MAGLYSQQQKSNSAALQDLLDKILSHLSPIQRKFVLDEARSKLARCPRRAGKSYADAGLMLYTAEKFAKSPIGYFGLTRDSAKEAIWDTLKEYIKACAIECDVNESQLRIDFPNGSVIRLFGADMENMKNRFRGRKFKLVIVDECAFYAALDDLITSVLAATLMDLQGTLVITSSPGLTKRSLFYKADQGKLKHLWSQHSWTLHDNPFFQEPSKNPKYATKGDEELDIICQTKFDGDRNHPEFRREYLGEWVFDEHALVYPLAPENVLSSLRGFKNVEFALGLNLSSPSQAGYVSLAFSEYGRNSQVVDAEKVKLKNFNDLSRLLAELTRLYKTDRIYCYLGDNKPEILDSFKQRHPFPVQATEYDKIPFYQMIIATDMDSGYVDVLDKCEDLLEEFGSTVKDDNGKEIPTDQGTPLSDAFFAVYLNIYNAYLKSAEPEETIDQKMERQLVESALAEIEERKDLYGY